MHLCYRCFKLACFQYFLICIILKYRLRDIENNSFTFKQDNLVNVPVKSKYYKLILEVVFIADYQAHAPLLQMF